ncbi:hypothetical protein [Streptantibioticus ferralitis]|uniref:Uncharacterized protein n=1 Tax=Streptantibioticus ferralitis TaxID=236510 RepID=A0ABT5Z760_9ACTN|nr:hypothetical protein [Streptantibioticus ferralitis]MDF2259675.1 hypothetical protein [Streptantibioticus ferralitis]
MSTTVPGAAAADAPEWVGRTYTKARRRTKVTGQWPGGGYLPFGPYTNTQLGVMVGSFALLAVVMYVADPFGWLVDLVLLVGVPVALGFAVRTVQVQGRNPLLAAASAVLLLTAPERGRLHGRPVKRLRPTRLEGLVTIGCCPVGEPTTPLPSATRPTSPSTTAAWSPMATAPIPAADTGQPAAGRGGVQTLLNRRRAQLTAAPKGEN